MYTSRLLVSILLVFISSEVFAATYAIRDNLLMNIYGGKTPARITIITSPAKPDQPVYAWRKHEYKVFPPYGSPFFVEGPLGYDRDYIGTTDGTGILDIYVPAVDADDIYCGRFTNERFAVGQNRTPETAPISFKIYQEIVLDFGPHPPISTKCKLENM